MPGATAPLLCRNFNSRPPRSSTDGKQQSRYRYKYSVNMKEPVDMPEDILQNGIANLGPAAEKWQGLALDTEAQRYWIGVHQAKAYCLENGLRFPPRPSTHVFIFGETATKSLDIITILVPMPLGLMPLSLDVVPLRIPGLPGLDLTYAHGIQDLSISNGLECIPDAHCRITWSCLSLLGWSIDNSLHSYTTEVVALAPVSPFTWPTFESLSTCIAGICRFVNNCDSERNCNL